jgi:C-terminal processing protease CtpA/Prc
MPDPISVGIAVGAAVGCSAIAQSRLQAARDAKAAERDASTISGILKDISLTTSRVRRGTYGRLASGSPRSAPQRRHSTKRVPIFALGEIAGLSVRVPADGKTCGPQGLLVTDILRGQWAQQCGVAAGARLMAIDGTRLEGLDAAAIRLAASSASRPIWLDVQKGGHAPTGDALSGAHLLL